MLIYIFSTKIGSILVKIGPNLLIKSFFCDIFFSLIFIDELEILVKRDFYHKKKQIYPPLDKMFFCSNHQYITDNKKLQKTAQTANTKFGNKRLSKNAKMHGL